MFIGKPAGNYDPILDFSTAVNGCLFFVPTADFLDDPGGAVGVAGYKPSLGRRARHPRTAPSRSVG